jgi:hypothetical protein
MDVKTSSQQINKLIKAVKTYGDKYNATVQQAIVAVIIHANDYGDCTGAARLVDAMPRSNRRQLVIDHFGDYSPISVSKDKQTGLFKATLRKPESKAFNAFNIDGVKANNWFERPEAERIPDVVTFSSIREKMLAQFESLLKKAEDIENQADKDDAIALIKAVRTAASNIVVASGSGPIKTEQPIGLADPEAAYEQFANSEAPKAKAA